MRQTLASDYAPQWPKALHVEYESLMKNLTWELIPRPKSTKERRINILTSLWVLVIKRNEKGEIDMFKARLAIRDFIQKYGIVYLQTFSPVVHIELVRLVMIMALIQGLDCRHFDFVAVFLNGELMDVEIYIEQPEGYNDGTGRVCRLLKGLYLALSRLQRFGTTPFMRIYENSSSNSVSLMWVSIIGNVLAAWFI
ncbi:putative mitochondrial protein [Phytophthora megakarya]|uniref:Putative mitochondrial protein n=1 Tax=Phytophthora megakarya TaxID=4795 RepID=A0A225W5X7_9STRA|nr:putative mitochondrial protein [Phytophthora megakarya]